ncbi:unnamed protein product [Schistosoma turkestanicum]|nr:unnamed protein product [Schistosoma turkestanicum]
MVGVFTKFVARGLFCRNIVLRQLTTSKSIASSNARFISNAEKFRKPNYKYSLHREPGISELNDIERFLRKQRIKGALYSAEVNAQATDGFWARIVKAGDPDLVERYLNMTARLGLPINPEKILKDLRDAGLTPTPRVYGSFIHHSCSAGDMNRTSHYLGMLQSAGFKPTRFIFSQILHGYVKARLPEEVISTQELLSQIGLWPSKFAYEGLLFAYADISDEESLLRTLDEAYTVLPSITDNQETEYSNEISASVLLDIYTRLICSLPNTNATCNEILKKLSAMDRFPFDFAIDSVKVLLAKGRPDAALEIFKINYSHERNNNHLSSLPTYAVAGGLTPKALEPFWEAADLDSKELLILRNKCKLKFNRTGKTNELGNQFQSCLNENNIEGGLNLLKNVPKNKTFKKDSTPARKIPPCKRSKPSGQS